MDESVSFAEKEPTYEVLWQSEPYALRPEVSTAASTTEPEIARCTRWVVGSSEIVFNILE